MLSIMLFGELYSFAIEDKRLQFWVGADLHKELEIPLYTKVLTKEPRQFLVEDKGPLRSGIAKMFGPSTMLLKWATITASNVELHEPSGFVEDSGKRIPLKFYRFRDVYRYKWTPFLAYAYRIRFTFSSPLGAKGLNYIELPLLDSSEPVECVLERVKEIADR